MWGNGKVTGTVNLPKQDNTLPTVPNSNISKMLLWANPNPSVNYISFALPSRVNPNPISFDTFDCSRSPTSHKLTLV